MPKIQGIFEHAKNVALKSGVLNPSQKCLFGDIFVHKTKNIEMPTIKNTTRKTILSRNAKVCSSIFSKSIGLMFSKKKKSLVFIFEREKIIPLHMLMVFYPIDVLFLDKERKVVEIKENFRPFAFYTPKKEALYVIELPQGIIKKTRTKLGDKLVLR